jgi:hypothetical protein
MEQKIFNTQLFSASRSWDHFLLVPLPKDYSSNFLVDTVLWNKNDIYTPHSKGLNTFLEFILCDFDNKIDFLFP